MANTVHILLIEDDDIDAELVERAFEKNKIANPLNRARDGVEALEMLRGENGRDRMPTPRLLLIDLNMPRMDGIEFLREVRADENLRQTISFILTTSKREEDKSRAYDLNVAGFLVKTKLDDEFQEMTEMLDLYWQIVEFP